MKYLLMSVLLSFLVFTSFSNGDSTLSVATQVSENSSILFVIKVPATEENKKQFQKIKDMEAKDVKVLVSAQFLELHYIGEQLTSAVEPSFIKEIKVYKDQKARDAYPNAGADNIIEMVVDNANTLIEVFYAIKAS